MADNHFKIHKGATLAPQTSEPANPVNGDMYYDDTLNRFRKYENGSWSEFGSGEGGGINYILNPGAETDLTGWSTYNDGAVAAPIDGIGGASSITFVRETTAADVVRGEASFRLAAVASEQGEGVSYDFTIDKADIGKKLNVSFDYTTSVMDAATVAVYIYDIDNATLLGRVENDDNGELVSAPKGSFTGSFQTTDANDYRLIIHVIGTDASWTMRFDNAKVSPDVLVPGAIITEWRTFTPAFSNAGTGVFAAFSSETAKWRRVGENIEIRVEGSWTTAGSGALSIELDVPSNANNVTFDIDSEPSGFYTGFDLTNSNVFRTCSMLIGAGGGIQFIRPETGGTVLGSDVVLNSQLRLYATVQVDGWSAGAMLSTTEANLQSVVAVYEMNGSTANLAFADAALEIADFNVKVIDTHNSVTTGASWAFTAPRDGRYFLSALMQWTTNANLVTSFGDLFKNGSVHRRMNFVGNDLGIPGSTIIDLVKGDTIDMRYSPDTSDSSTRVPTTSPPGTCTISITSLPDFNTFSVFGENEFLAATSSVKSVTASSVWSQFTGNSITLTPGTWIIHGEMNFSQSGGSPDYTNIQTRWDAANGDDTGTTPTALNPSIIDAGDTDRVHLETSSIIEQTHLSAPTLRVTVTSDTSIYLNAFIIAALPTRGRLTAYIYAERIA